MALWEYLWAGSAITKWLYHLNWNANDSSWNGNNWTAANVTWVDWKVGSWAASFNGSNSTINKTWLSLSFSEITISCWLKKKRNLNNERFVCLFFWGVHEISIMSYNTTEWNLWIVWYFNGWSFLGMVNTWISNNNRMYVTLTAGSGFNRLYINWVQQTLTYDKGTPSSGLLSNTFSQWGIGSNSNNAQFAQAEIDEVIIENRAWTATEIQKYYTYSSWKFGIQ